MSAGINGIAQALEQIEPVRHGMAKRGVVEDAPALIGAMVQASQSALDAAQGSVGIGVVINPRRAVQAEILQTVVSRRYRCPRVSRGIGGNPRDAPFTQGAVHCRMEP